ncbi:MAG: ABC transporter substrate-binding protein [Nostoc sp.]
MPTSIARYFLLAFTTFLLVTGCSPQSTQSNSPQVEQTTASSKKLEMITIGHQSGTPGLNLLKAQGYLEKRFASDGITIKWIQFRGGPPMIEAMAANSVDIGNVGNLPPIFAQAGDNPIVYVAATGSNAGAQAVIVRKDSPIKTLAELKGKKVAIQKGTALQYLLLKAIASAGLSLNDIQPAYLTIPESQVAFEGGKVDVLPTSDPYII